MRIACGQLLRLDARVKGETEDQSERGCDAHDRCRAKATRTPVESRVNASQGFLPSLRVPIRLDQLGRR